jgi:hypothetical protein
MKGLFRKIPAPLPAQRASPDNMRRRHDADRDGFPAPFASENGLRVGFSVHLGSQFRRMKNECPVPILTPASILVGGNSLMEGRESSRLYRSESTC